VAIAWGAGQAAAGRFYVPLEFTNTLGRTCTLRGYPRVALTTGTAPGSQAGAGPVRQTDRPEAVITLAPGATASATLQIVNVQAYPSSTCGQVSASYVQVYPPGQASAVYLPYKYTGLPCSKPVYQLGIWPVATGTALAS
jgi:Protein of unknown function (DUF4232)